MISPLGSFLSLMDNTLNTSVDRLIEATTSAVATPVTIAAVIHFGVQGFKLANGDATPAHTFVLQAVRVSLVIWLSSNLDAFNRWVKDFFFLGLPNSLNAAAASANAGAADGAAATARVGGVQTTAATFDLVWSQMWTVLGRAKAEAGFLDPLVLAVDIAGILGGLSLLAMALIYLLARLILAIVVVAMPILIACAMTDVTRPIFERGIGKMIALIFLQFAGIVVLQLVITGDQIFLDQIIAAQRAHQGGGTANCTAELETYLPGACGLGTGAVPGTSAGAALATTMQVVVAMVVWLMGGAFALYALPAIAYSIGTGIAISTAPAMLGTGAAARESVHLMQTLLGKLDGLKMPAVPSLPTSPNLSLSMAPKALPAPGNVLPPPPPPPLIGRS